MIKTSHTPAPHRHRQGGAVMNTVTRFDRFLFAGAFAGASFYLVACSHLVALLVRVMP